MSLESFLTTHKLNDTRLRTRAIKSKQAAKPPVKRKAASGTHKAKVPMVADFETITDPSDCRVWAWGLATLERPNYADVEIGNSIEGFIDRISQHNATVYFHNLKFDGHFLLYWLLTNGFYFVHTEFVKRPFTFKVIINDMGRFYSITVKWENGNVCEFRDSLNKLPMSVKHIAESFGLEDSKGDLDYDAYRAPGHKLTKQEEDYLRRDVAIIATALKESYDQGMKKLTVASDSLAEYKQIVGVEWFRRMFPIFNEKMDAEIRRAYRGGWTYLNPKFKGYRKKIGLVLDVNSLYPFIMMARILPFGEPRFFEGKFKPTKERPLGIFSVTFTAKLKKDYLPCIQIKGHSLFAGTEYLTNISDPVTLMMTNVDWELYQEHYDIDILEYGGGWAFNAMRGLFDEYINKWSKIKAEAKGGLRELAKLHLNSLYGKFASNPNVTGKFPKLINNIVKLITGQPETKAPVYTAMGVFITSWARDLTIRAAQKSFPVFAYADTDSLHLITEEIPEGIEVDPSKLGAWKLEYMFSESDYIRAKAYMERETSCSVDLDKLGQPHEFSDGDITTHIAGLPESVTNKMMFSDLIDGKILKGKLKPRIVPGGVVLEDIDFTLKR